MSDRSSPEANAVTAEGESICPSVVMAGQQVMQCEDSVVMQCEDSVVMQCEDSVVMQSEDSVVMLLKRVLCSCSAQNH